MFILISVYSKLWTFHRALLIPSFENESIAQLQNHQDKVLLEARKKPVTQVDLQRSKLRLRGSFDRTTIIWPCFKSKLQYMEKCQEQTNYWCSGQMTKLLFGKHENITSAAWVMYGYFSQLPLCLKNSTYMLIDLSEWVCVWLLVLHVFV